MVFLKALKWIGILAATLLVGAYLAARAAPIAYLQMVSHIGLAPISITLVLERANSDWAAGTYDFCENPVLFAWYGSFGGGPVLTDDRSVPNTAEFDEVVLFRSGVIYETTKTALAEMAIFNEKVLSECVMATDGQ